MRIKIKNLRLRTIIGVCRWERRYPQDIIINVTMEFDGAQAVQSDDIKDTVDYATTKRRIIKEVEKASFNLLEKLAGRILELVMEDPKVQNATVEIDKPNALRFADSVSVRCSAERKE